VGRGVVKHLPGTCVIAVDPGKLSGFSMLCHEQFEASELEFPEIVTRVDLWAKEHMIQRDRLVIAVEREVIRPSYALQGRGDQNWSMEIIGCLRYLASRYSHMFKLYNSSDTMKFAPDDTLIKLGWYRSGLEGHANDASRVLALALATVDPLHWKHLVVASQLLREERP
jgi:hypothetical protein